MLRNIEHWQKMIRDMRMKATTTDDPYILKAYDELIDQYEANIRKLLNEAKTPDPPADG